MNKQQFLTDNQGNKIGIFLSIKDYNKLLDAWEELEDIKDYDKAKAKNEETIPLIDAIKMRKRRKNA